MYITWKFKRRLSQNATDSPDGIGTFKFETRNSCQIFFLMANQDQTISCGISSVPNTDICFIFSTDFVLSAGQIYRYFPVE